jgi:putative ABC transport system permease protein
LIKEPYKDFDRTFMIWENPPDHSGKKPVSIPNYEDWRDRNHSFESLAAWLFDSFTLAESEPSEPVFGNRVTGDYFALTQPKIALGRTFLREEETAGKDRVVIFNYQLWQRRFGGDPGLIGRTVTLNGLKHTVVGVMHPSGFDRRDYLWVPLAFEGGHRDRGDRLLAVAGRLKPGVRTRQAKAEMDAIAGSLAQEYPATNKDWGVALTSFREQGMPGRLRQTMHLLFGAVVFVLLIACANIANLMLARGAGRQREVAIRMALGAGPAQLIKQFLTESVLLALVGAVLGLLLTFWFIDGIRAYADDFPYWAEVSVNGRVLLFMLCISILSGVAFGSAPAWQAGRTQVNEALKESARGASAGSSGYRIRNLLIVSEVALALMLLVGAGLLIRTFIRLQKVDPGFQTRNLLVMQLSAPQTKYSSPVQVSELYRQLLQGVQAVPGVARAGIVTQPPLFGWGIEAQFRVEGKAEKANAHFQVISPDYFRAMEIPFIQGRTFTERDLGGSSPVIMVNQALARQFFPNGYPIGKHLILESQISNQIEAGVSPLTARSWEIVGVVGNVKESGLFNEEGREVYVPYSQNPVANMTLVVKTRTDPAGMIHPVKAAIHEIEKELPVAYAETMESLLDSLMSPSRFRMTLLSFFGGLALLLAAVGIYGVISYSLSQRTQELGIRMALGSSRKDLMTLVVRQGMAVVGAGLAVGFGGVLLWRD